MIANSLNSKSLNNNVKRAYALSEEISGRSKNKKIQKGSDEHLDQIITTTKELNKLISVISKINNTIEETFPSKRKDAEELKIIIHALYSSITAFTTWMNKKHDTKSEYADCLENLRIEYDQLKEYIDDLSDYVISDDKLISDDFFKDM